MGDSTGKPLDYGMVYFGQPNKDPEFYPINIYYDEALTMAAAQPVRTKGGFLNANGDMVEVFAAATEYSVKVLDSYGRQVFYQASMSSVNTSTSVSAQLPYIGAATRNQLDKNSDVVSINDFTSPEAAYAAAIDNNISIYVPSGDFTLSTVGADMSIFYGIGTINGEKVYYDSYKPPVQGQNKRKVIAELPLMPVGGTSVLAKYSASYMYPQGFTIDAKANEVWLYYSPAAVVVYDLKTMAHKTTFYAGSGDSGEGIAVYYTDDGNRRLLVRNGTVFVSVYDINTLPSQLSSPTPLNTYDVNLHFQFYVKAGMLYAEQSTQELRYTGSTRRIFNIFDLRDMAKGSIGAVVLDPNERTSTLTPKRQGFAVGDGLMYGSYGVFQESSSATSDAKNYHGIRVFSPAGDVLRDMLVPANDFIARLNENGYNATRIENEGVCVTDGRVHSLWAITAAGNTTNGILIFEEFSVDKDAIDFSDITRQSNSFISKGVPYRFVTHPFNDSKALNPSTGAVMGTFAEMMTFMIANQIPSASFDSTSFSDVTDFTGATIGTARTVELFNRNNAESDGNFAWIRGAFDNYGMLADGSIIEGLHRTNFRPLTDNAVNIGDPARRWKQIYAATGTISTSDERLKTKFDDLQAAEKRAALKIKESIGRYKFTDAVDNKGNKARYHFGVGAQTVGKILQDEGLNPEQYAFYCYDEWEATDDVEAGNRYGIRYDGLIMFILAAI
ncbi:tail fiber domain-containing protein [Psychrobacter celer]|uniref:tail fiber domain-containing protein n=1 Tax=Psychrobacter celer TaxID=306572 RepID=UPI003FCF611A